MDQTRLTVHDAYQTFFTNHRVKTDKKERTINEEEETSTTTDHRCCSIQTTAIKFSI
jgi:hypothetical protein